MRRYEVHSRGTFLIYAFHGVDIARGVGASRSDVVAQALLDYAAGNQVDVNAGCGFINVSNFSSPYSFHSGGVNALRCDGSVTFLNANTAPANLFAFFTRNGGEVLTIN